MSTRAPLFPSRIGAILLPEATLFPGSLLPLFIFEPRYRLMLSRALESDRMFAVALVDGDSEGAVGDMGGVGIVRACISNADGTFNLILQGLARVRFSHWSDEEPYPTAEITPLAAPPATGKVAQSLRREIAELLEERLGGALPGHVLALLDHAADASAFADLASSCFVAEAPVRRRLFEETDALRRLEILAAYLSSTPAFPA